MVAEYEYDAWGNCTILNNVNGVADLNPLRYRGYYYDTDTELYYLQSRYYDANIGRFINSDDLNVIISFDGFEKKVLGLNLFSYGNNNPILNRDAYGYVALFDDLTMYVVLYILASAGVITSSSVATSGGISWGGNSPATTTVNIENIKLLTVL